MLDQLDVLYVRERYGDLLREAEHDQSVAELRTQSWTRVGLHRRALLRLGLLLVAAGECLQLASHHAYSTETKSIAR